MNIQIYEYVIAQLELRKGTWPKIAHETDIPYRTLQKIGSGETADPGVSLIQKLADYFRTQEAKAA